MNVIKNMNPYFVVEVLQPLHTRSCILVWHVGSCSCILTQRGFVQGAELLSDQYGTDAKIYRMTQTSVTVYVLYVLDCSHFKFMDYWPLGLDLHVILRG